MRKYEFTFLSKDKVEGGVLDELHNRLALEAASIVVVEPDTFLFDEDVDPPAQGDDPRGANDHERL